MNSGSGDDGSRIVCGACGGEPQEVGPAPLPTVSGRASRVQAVCGCRRLHLIRCIVSGVASADRSPSKPQRYLSMSEIADLLGVSVNTVKSYVFKDTADFPPPDAIIGHTRGWLLKPIQEWHRNRPRPHRTPHPSLSKGRRGAKR